MREHAAGRDFPEAGRFLLVAFAGFLAFGLSVVPRFQAISAVFVSLVIEGVPFLIAGSIVAAAVERYVTPAMLARAGRRLGVGAIPAAGLAGLAVPICECAIVPTVRRLREKGLPLPVAITFLLAVPLVNPIVLASSLLAFPDRPDIVIARFVGGFAIALIVGFGWWWWVATARERTTRPPTRDETLGHTSGGAVHDSPGTAIKAVSEIAAHAAAEFVSVLRFFVIGAGLSSVLGVLLPTDAIAADTIPGVAAIAAMMALAYLLSICSEADAFVARGFLAVAPAEAVVCFLIFGPMIDLKNTLLLRRVLSRRELVVLISVVSGLVVLVGVVYGFVG